MRLKSQNRGQKAENREQRGRRQKTEGREQNRERAVLLELFVYLLHYIVCLGEGDQDCASKRDPDRPPPSPHPKEFIKIGLRPIAWTAIFATAALRIGATLDLLAGVEKTEKERCY